MKKVRIKMIGAVVFCLLFIIGCGGGGGDSQTVIAEPGISVTDESPGVTFNGVVVKNSAEKQFRIRSTGTRTLHVGAISSNNSNYSISAGYDNCSGQALAVGASCTFIVRYQPTSQKNPDSGTISISGDVPATIALSGFSYGLNVWINQIVSATCDEVVVDVTLTDPNNTGTTFAQSNFEPLLGAITQGGDPQTITDNGFSAIDPDSVSAVLALDLSDSLTSAIGNIRDAAAAFIDDRMALNDEAAMIKFKDDITSYPATGFTITNLAGKDKFTNLTTGFIYDETTDPSTDGTSLYDAVYEAITKAWSGTKGTKAVIVLSDGSNQGTPTYSLAQVIAHANDLKIPVFTIYYVDPDPRYFPDAKPEIMAQLAKDTGGQDFYAERTSMDNIFTQIWSALTKKYRITYKPTTCTRGAFDLRVDAGSGTLRGFDTETVVFP